MLLIDTHTHLFTDAFNEDRNDVVGRAIANGVEKMLLPNIDIESIEPMFQLCNQFPDNCYPMLGIHPCAVDTSWKEVLGIVEQKLFSSNVIAVGEIGMDLYWDKTFRNEQVQVFRIQIEWAKQLGLPVVLHVRNAFEDVFKLIDELNDERLTGVFHCFSGSLEQAKKIQQYGGFKLGIGGVLTYPKSKLELVLREIPIEMIVLETDSPYLTPTPHRGERNESAYLLYVAEKLASIKKVSLDHIAAMTTLNAKQLFNLS